MAKNEAKIRFTADTSDFNDALKKASSTMTELQSELRLVDAQMKNTGATVEGLEQKHAILTQQQAQQAAKVEALTGKYEAAARIWGQNSAEAQKYATQLNNAKVKQEQLKGDVSRCNAELQEARAKMGQDETAAKQMGDAFDAAGRDAKELGASVGDIAAGNIVADFAGNAVSSMAGLVEATQQYRNEQNKLEAIAQSSGQSLDALKGQYSDLYAITSDETLSATAVSNLSAMGLSAEDSGKLVHAATGIWAQYGDSIPLDGLMESINETSKVSTVTGTLADALNWAGINEDDFNAKLAECSTEQERQQLITETLEGAYGDLADSYIESNEAVMETARSNEELMDSQSRLAEAIAPVQAAVTGFAADGLGFLADNLSWIAPLVLIVAGAFGALALALNFGAITTALTTSLTAIGGAIAGLSAPILPIIAVVAALAAAVVYLWNTNEGFRNAVTLAWEGIKSAIQAVCDALMPIIQPIFEQIAAFLDGIMNGTIAPIISGALGVISGLFQTVCGAITAVTTGDFTTLSDGVSSIMSGLSSALGGILNGIKSVFGSVFGGVLSTVTGIFSSIYNAIKSKIDSAKNAVTNAINRIKSAFNFSWSLPKLKLPHVSISGRFSINPPSVPRFSVSWYAKAMDNAMVLTSPTIFGLQNGRFLGGGEAGREVVSGESHLMELIGTVVRRAMPNDGTDRIVAAVEKLADRVTVLEVNGRVLATATAGDADAVNGSRQMLVDRGLTL